MARCWKWRAVVHCYHGRDGDWLSVGSRIELKENRPIDHLDRHSGRCWGWRALGCNRRRVVVRLRWCGWVSELGPSGLVEAMVGRDGPFRCSKLEERWRHGNSLRCQGRLPRRRE